MWRNARLTCLAIHGRVELARDPERHNLQAMPRASVKLVLQSTQQVIEMASSSPTPEAAAAAPIPDDEHTADLPLTMSASVVLTALPQDAHAALAQAGASEQRKGMRDSSYIRITKLIGFPFSYRALQGSRLCAYPPPANVQDYSVTALRDCGEFSAKSSQVRADRLGVSLRQFCLCTCSGRDCREYFQGMWVTG